MSSTGKLVNAVSTACRCLSNPICLALSKSLSVKYDRNGGIGDLLVLLVLPATATTLKVHIKAIKRREEERDVMVDLVSLNQDSFLVVEYDLSSRKPHTLWRWDAVVEVEDFKS